MARIIEREKTNIVGEMVRYYRKERKMSQRALSIKLELMGYTFAAVRFQELRTARARLRILRFTLLRKRSGFL